MTFRKAVKATQHTSYALHLLQAVICVMLTAGCNAVTLQCVADSGTKPFQPAKAPAYLGQDMHE